METKAKCILAMVAMSLLITPAFSQGGERDGPNGNPGSNMGSGQDNAMMAGPNEAPFGQVGEIKHGLAPDAPKFKGCDTDPQMKPNMAPIKPPADKPEGSENELNPEDAPHDEPAPWSYIKPGDGQHDGAAFGFMDGKHRMMHKKPLKSLADKDFPELPSMKSIMNHGR
ncbi:MAG: hypothetical protein PHS80_07315 [Methanothrix sp.]|nr:hypothetical protein [Methanothrix sp.]